MAATSILLVDDDRDTCVSLSDILSDFGFGVDTVYDSASALKFSGRNEYRLALLGYRMPDMNGVELCRRLKSFQSEMEVALVTRFASAEIADAAIEVGVRKIFPKPVDLARLIRFVETVVGQLMERAIKAQSANLTVLNEAHIGAWTPTRRDY